MAQEYGVSHQTVRCAIKVVAKRGLVVGIKGKGVFLTSPRSRCKADAKIDPIAPMWPFRQLACILAARILRGDWKPNEPLPSEARLVNEYGLVRTTVRRAIRSLTDHNVVFVVPGRGSYIAIDGRNQADTFMHAHKSGYANGA